MENDNETANKKIENAEHHKQHQVSVADFETALKATGFGRFNFVLLLISIAAGLAPIFETTTMSLVFPAAQCDLDLSLQNKGTLNAITYLGMITSGLVWGFLADTLGRRKLLIVGYLLDALVVLCSAFSQTFQMLAIFKYLGGFVINGPHAVFTSYVSEFHAAEYRSRIQLMLGMVYSLASIILPFMAWIVYSFNPNVQISSYFKLFNWNFFLLLCTLPSLLAGITIIFMPESPKFLMTAGRNKEALNIFQKVYSKNTGQPLENYPIKALMDEVKQLSEKKTKTQAMKEGLDQLKPLIKPPYLSKFLLVCLIQTAIITGINSLRLWLPQMFIAIDNYKNSHGGETSTLCEMLSMVQGNVTVVDGSKKCNVEVDSMSAYMNVIIVATVCIFAYVLMVVLINHVRKKFLLVTLGFIAGCCSTSLYFSAGTASVLILSSIFQAASNVSSNIMLSIAVEIFPTTLRTIVVAVMMMCGRIGAVSGNIVFPMLLNVGCLPPFLLTGLTLLVCSITSLFLPKTDMKALE